MTPEVPVGDVASVSHFFSQTDRGAETEVNFMFYVSEGFLTPRSSKSLMILLRSVTYRDTTRVCYSLKQFIRQKVKKWHISCYLSAIIILCHLALEVLFKTHVYFFNIGNRKRIGNFPAEFACLCKMLFSFYII